MSFNDTYGAGDDLSVIIDDPDALLAWFEKASTTAASRRAQIQAASRAAQDEFDAELGLPGCDISINQNAIGGITRSARLDSRADLSDAQWEQLGAFMAAHDITGLDTTFIPRTDLDFLQYVPFITALNFAERATSIEGLHCLSDQLQWLAWSTQRKYSLDVLRRFPHLRVLAIGRGKDFDVLAELRELRWISVNNTAMPTLDVLTGLPNIQRVTLGSGKPPDLSALATLPQLQFLDIGQWRQLTNTDLAVLSDCTGLRALELSGLPSVTALPDLSRLTHLQVVAIESMKSLVDIGGLAAAPNLTWLWAYSKAFTNQSFAPFLGHPTLTSLAPGESTAVYNAVAEQFPNPPFPGKRYDSAYINYRAALYHHTGGLPSAHTS
ncbi:hypothetical protein QN239_02035 [Mycolicibacterium sp. Y3]